MSDLVFVKNEERKKERFRHCQQCRKKEKGQNSSFDSRAMISVITLSPIVKIEEEKKDSVIATKERNVTAKKERQKYSGIVKNEERKKDS